MRCLALVGALLTGCDEPGPPPTSTGSESGEGMSTVAETSSTGASEGSTGREAVAYEGDIQPIWNARCTCHLQGPSGTMQATTLTLNPGLSHAELFETPSTQVPGLPRVAPGDLQGSYLWHKLQGTHTDVGGEGDAMPPGAGLDAAELALIEAWIEQGASS